MKLTQHYAGHNVCAPSRCVLMTGKHPGHAYIRNHRGGVGIAGGDGSEGQEPVPAGELKLPVFPPPGVDGNVPGDERREEEKEGVAPLSPPREPRTKPEGQSTPARHSATLTASGASENLPLPS